MDQSTDDPLATTQATCAVCFKPCTNPMTLLRFYKEYVNSRETPSIEVVSSNHLVCHIHHLFEVDTVNPKCQKHMTNDLNLFCEQCRKVICCQCTVEEHRSHQFIFVKSTFSHFQGILSLLKEAIEINKTKILKELTDINRLCTHLEKQSLLIKRAIDDNIKAVHEATDNRKSDLTDQLHQIKQQQMALLEDQKRKISLTQVKHSDYLYSIGKVVSGGSHDEISKKVSEMIRLMNNESEVMKTEAKHHARIELSLSTESIFQDIQKLGIVSACEVSPQNCFVHGKGLETALVHEKSILVLYAINCDGKQCEKPIATIHCEVVSEITGEKVSGIVEKRVCTRNQYEISYEPVIKGRHLLHITVGGEHIRGSPFTVSVKLPSIEFSSSLLTISEVVGPWGVAVNQQREIVITENKANRISVFNVSGRRLRKFDLHNCSNEESPPINERNDVLPSEVVIDDQGDILVAVRRSHCIEKFSADGQFIKSVGTKGKDKLQFNNPTGIAINSSNKKIYVTDVLNHRVQILNKDLTHFQSFGKHGNGNGEFVYPTSVACDSKGDVYVVDNENNRVQIFNSNGVYSRQFGKCGNEDGSFNRPVGIAIDINDTLYVSERGNKRVSVFTSEGRFLTSFSGGETFDPCALAVDDTSVVYVCNYKGLVVQLF